MDSIAQIKNNLILRIKGSKDLDFLKALQTIFDTSEQGLFQLSQDHETSIERGRKDIENGDFMDNEFVISEMREWLSKK